MTIDQVMAAIRSEYDLKSYMRDYIEGLLVEYGRSLIERCAAVAEDNGDAAGQDIASTIRSLKP